MPNHDMGQAANPAVGPAARPLHGPAGRRAWPGLLRFARPFPRTLERAVPPARGRRLPVKAELQLVFACLRRYMWEALPIIGNRRSIIGNRRSRRPQPPRRHDLSALATCSAAASLPRTGRIVAAPTSTSRRAESRS